MSGFLVDPGAPLPEPEEHFIDVDEVQRLLGAAGIASRAIGTSGGCITVYVGEGDWDEAAEQWTQPLSIGPCFLGTGRGGTRVLGLIGEMEYGRRDYGEGVDEPTAPSVIADALIRMYREILP